jgi:hypothetical protein
MGRSAWNGLQKSTILAAGTAIGSAALVQDSKQDLHLKAEPFLLMSTYPRLPLPPLNNSFASVDLDSSLKTMSSVYTNKAASASRFTDPINAKCTLYPMLLKLGFHYSSEFCPKTPLLCLKNPNSQIASPALDTKRSVINAGTSYFCLYSSSSCLKLSPNDFSHSLRRTHLNISNPCLYSSCRCQCLGLKHLQGSSDVLARSNTLSYLRPSSFYCFHLASPNSFPSSKLTPFSSIFSSLISPSLFSSASYDTFSQSPYSTESKSFHVWHSPDGDGEENKSFASDRKPVVTVVLLGWLGAKQKHLKKYVNWYTARGIHAVTFAIPMEDLLSFKPGEIVEHRIEILAQELACWLSGKENDGRERGIVFHTFSNAGWLSYGVILEKFIMMGDLYNKIKGCVVDSAPEPKPNPKVWALGFSAALLNKRSRLTHPTYEGAGENSEKKDINGKPMEQIQTLNAEAALLAILEKFFFVVFKLPHVNQRLSEVTSVLSKNQPPCPQLYIYSTADRIIPAESVESFIKEQKKAGKQVKACNMKSSPHVDHFRSFPDIYTKQLHSFLEECTQIIPR